MGTSESSGPALRGVKAVEWAEGSGKVRLLDQTRLPQRKVFIEYDDYRELAKAIKEMRVRGAPAIGVAAAYGIALGAQKLLARERDAFLKQLEGIIETFVSTRPTAVNLFKAASRMREAAKQGASVAQIKAALRKEAVALHREEDKANKAIARYGATLIGRGATILTHCNAGSLATAAYGTALGVIRAAYEQGKDVKVIVTETRPLLQGARLTAWELKQWGIPVTIITDSMAGHFLKMGEVDCVIVGADRVVANGDVANKIGTYTMAVLATENGIPFYVAAPTSTVDLSLSSGELIPIEQRAEEEVIGMGGKRFAPRGVHAANPAFDVTPHYYISAIITEKGVLREPYSDHLKALA